MDEYEQSSTKEIDSNFSLLPPHLEPNFDTGVIIPIKKIDYQAVENCIDIVREVNSTIRKKLEITENLDITTSILTYKIYDAKHELKNKINAFKEERNKLLASVSNKSELSLILHDLDKKISTLNRELELKINHYNEQKINLQEQMENTMSQLDEDVNQMQSLLADLKNSLAVDEKTMYRTQLEIINQKYTSSLKEFAEDLNFYEHLHLKGWRMEESEAKLAEMLETRGLKFTPSGRLLTRTGSRITFEEAHQKGFFKELDITLEKILAFFKDSNRELLQEPIPDHSVYSEGSSVESKMSSEDVKYLKEYVGKPLTFALAEITAKQPRDPIHYLAHYLFKYRHNQELAEVQKKEVDELTKERKILAEEKWKKIIAQEARDAVIDMILKAEEIAVQNELRRIEREQMLLEEEWEAEEDKNQDALLEEAKDKFK